jgi:hypothetical protein
MRNVATMVNGNNPNDPVVLLNLDATGPEASSFSGAVINQKESRPMYFPNGYSIYVKMPIY